MQEDIPPRPAAKRGAMAVACNQWRPIAVPEAESKDAGGTSGVRLSTPPATGEEPDPDDDPVPDEPVPISPAPDHV